LKPNNNSLVTGTGSYDDAMGWSCGACTYFNTVESLNKCAICETARSNESSQDGAPSAAKANENCSKKRSKEQKSTVQATLFGGISTNGETRISKNKKSKPSFEIDAVARPNVSFASTRHIKTFTSTSSTDNRFEIWKQTAKTDIPFSKLEERTRSAMKQIFSVDKLRLLQPKAVKCALKRKSQLVVMATGGGMY
jgi:hypothetical protein